MTTVSKAPRSPRGKSGLLAEIGEELFGSTYVIGLSKLTGVTTKTVRRWLDDTHPVPPWVWACLSKACTAKITRLKRDELAAHGRYLIDTRKETSP